MVLTEDALPADLPSHTLAAEELRFRADDGTWGYDEPNAGYGDARFSPFDAVEDQHRVPSMYLAQTAEGALLETVFHDVHQDAARLIYERSLRNTLLAHVGLPDAMRVADLRDPILSAAGIARETIVSSPSEHFPCTRRLARRLHRLGVEGEPVQGLVWHSRQGELLASPPVEVAVLFADRYAVGRGGWERVGPGSQNLIEGPGRLLIDQIATALDATIVA